MRYSTEQTREAFGKLPENIQDAIASIDTLKTIREISKKYGLLLDVASKLEEEVGYALLGLTKPTEFSKTIKTELSIDEKKAEEITIEINIKIFAPLKRNLVSGATVLPQNTGTGISSVIKEVVNQEKKPVVTKISLPKEEASPHEADYDMSRDAILSAIENPPKAETKSEYSPSRSPESSSPEEYLLKRQGLSALLEKLEKSGAATKKSLSEEAVLIAKKKVEETDGANIEKILVPSKISPIPQQKSPLSPPIKTPTPFVGVVKSPEAVVGHGGIKIKPGDKLTSVVQIPSTKTEIKKAVPATLSSQTKSVDPYRETV